MWYQRSHEKWLLEGDINLAIYIEWQMEQEEGKTLCSH
jgi:hypothetical protein